MLKNFLEKLFSEKPGTNIFVEKYDLGTGFPTGFRQNEVFRVQTIKKSQKCDLRGETAPVDPENMTQRKYSGYMPVHKVNNPWSKMAKIDEK